MAIEVKIPNVGESITSANVARWHFQDGDVVKAGDVLLTIETDKVSNDLEAEESGVLKILIAEDHEVPIGSVVAEILASGEEAQASTPAPTPAPKMVGVVEPIPASQANAEADPIVPMVPAAQVSQPASSVKEVVIPSVELKPDFSVTPDRSARGGEPQLEEGGRVTRKKMSMLRRKIANHLVNAQQTAAILTTFNEVDMSAIMQLRKDVQEGFVAKHGCKLGFMSFFVKAVVQALKDVPSVNGRIDGNDIIQNHFYDIGVAIGTAKGLVVPVVRDCDTLTLAGIEQGILDYAKKAQNGTMELSHLQGGVFTISNGGVYGSLLSTPILNAPQSGILGMHTIQQRPVAVNGEVVIRPMMNLALSYDHRLVDGKEAVIFLIRIKECLENPTLMLLER